MEEMKRRAEKQAYRLLESGSKKFKTDLFYLTKGSFWLSLGKAFTIITGLILSVAFANLLSPDVYGNYRFILSLAGIVTTFSLTGMNTAVTRAVARGFEGALALGFKTKLKWSIGIAAAAFIGALYYFVNDNTTLGTSLLIVGTFSPFMESSRLYAAYFHGKKDFRTNTLLGLLRRTIPMTLLLITLFLTDNVVTIIFVYFASQTATLLSIYYSTYTRIQEKNTTGADEIISDSKHLSLMNVFSNLAGHLDKILVFHFLGATPLAVYAFATMPPGQLRKVSDILKALLLPKLSQRNFLELKLSLQQKALLIAAVTVPITALYIVSAPYLYTFIFPQYTESVIYSQIFALSLLTTPFLVFGQALTAHMKKRSLYILRISRYTLQIVLLAILLPLYGIWGAITTLLVAQVYNSILVTILFYWESSRS